MPSKTDRFFGSHSGLKPNKELSDIYKKIIEIDKKLNKIVKKISETDDEKELDELKKSSRKRLKRKQN